MKYLVLGHSLERGNPAYRGTYRTRPFNVHSVENEHPVNQAFFAYLIDQDALGTTTNLDNARNLVERYSQLTPPQDFEIVVVSTDKTAHISGEFLGYDLASGFHFSLLARHLGLSDEQRSQWAEDSKLGNLLPLVQLVAAYFVPRLNENALFGVCQDAEFCLQCMIALQKLYPDLWESDQAVFEIVALYKVD